MVSLCTAQRHEPDARRRRPRSGSASVGGQRLRERAKRSRAVREAVLLVEGDLGHRQPAIGQEEERVIAEAGCAARRVEESALTSARARNLEGTRRIYESGDATVARRAARGRDVAQRLEELGVVGDVAGAEAGV